METAPRHIVLVHGTILVPWLSRKGPTWIRPDHPFRQQLAETYPRAEIASFRWRGGNLHANRLRAAHDLAEVIDNRDGPLLVIGHSHGGNVARMGLQLARERTDETQLVTLATPFLNVRWHVRDRTGRRRARVGWQAWTSFIWSALLGLMVMTSLVAGVQESDPLGSLVETDAAVSPEVSARLVPLLATGASIALATLGLALALAVALAVLQGIGGLVLGRTIADLEIDNGEDWLTQVDTRQRRGALAGTRSEVVAVENDEAAWSLNLGQAAGSIGAVLGSGADVRRLHGRLRLFLNIVVTAPVVVVLVSGQGWELRFPALKVLSWVQGTGSGYGDELLAGIGVLLVGFGLLGLLGLSIHLFEYLTAGWDSLVVADRARLSVSTAPPGDSSVTLLDLCCGQRGGLRHSRIYEDAEAREAVVSVVRRTAPPENGPLRAA